MFNIADFLKRFTDLKEPAFAEKAAITKVVKSVINISLASRCIDIKGTKAYLRVAPAVKALLVIKQGVIAAEVSASTGGKVTEVH